MSATTLSGSTVTLAAPRGFCAGVVRAVEIVERALEIYGPPVYVLHEIVHNQRVLEELRGKGAVFVETLGVIPSGAKTIFSAHGVATARFAEAQSLGLDVIDATCPLVTKVHLQAQHYAEKGYTLLIVGHPGHPEVEGTRGRVDSPVHVVSSIADVEQLQLEPTALVAYVTQTTLSLDDALGIVGALKNKYPEIKGPDTKNICYATQNRQTAVKNLARKVDVVLIVGANNSSNSNRLREVGEQHGCRAYLVQDAQDLRLDWFRSGDRIGVSAGASTPESLVAEICAKLQAFGIQHIKEMAGITESIHFRLPREVEYP